jgi:hypothetical protein
VRSILFAAIALIVCALLNPGNFGTIDTLRRLQVARWIRLGEPPVAPSDTVFGITGKDGNKQTWYGIGQSLVLVPFDAVASGTAGALLTRSGLEAEKQQQIVVLVIAFLMQSCIAFSCLWMAYSVLRLFNFSERESVTGALALLFATTCLQYVQSAQENNLLLLLALIALYAIRRFQRGDGSAWAVLAGAGCAFAIIVRLPSVLETAVLFGFAISVGDRTKQFAFGFVPPVLCGLAVDRWYQWHRFGDVLGTYMGVFGRQARPAGVPASFPFSYPFWKGFAGTLFSGDKSIFLFDPLLLVLLFLIALRWRTLHAHVRKALAWFGVLLIAYSVIYAKYFDFGGDVAWGHRFVTLPVHLLSLFAVPLLLRLGKELPAVAARVAWSIVFCSVLLQAASTAVAPNLEVSQRDGGYGHSVIVNRAINLVELVSNRQVRGANVMPVEWRSLYYFPFQLRFRFPQLAKPAIILWVLMLLSLPVMVGLAVRKS